MTPPPTTPSKGPIRVGGAIQASKLVHSVEPVYPELTHLMRVTGLVILEALVSEAGEVQDVKVLRGHPLLNTAAIEAVRKWRYSPTTLNDKPVSVLATVYVNFEATGDSDSKSLLLRMDETGILWEGEVRLDGEQLLERVAEVGNGARTETGLSLRVGGL